MSRSAMCLKQMQGWAHRLCTVITDGAKCYNPGSHVKLLTYATKGSALCMHARHCVFLQAATLFQFAWNCASNNGNSHSLFSTAHDSDRAMQKDACAPYQVVPNVVWLGCSIPDAVDVLA